jgi:uncharacterized protein
VARVAWSPEGWRGFEDLRLEESPDGARLDGWALAVFEAAPLRVAYEIRCDAAWRVRSAHITCDDRHLSVQSDGEGRWRHGDGQELPALDGCTDVDLQLTPATNTLPIRRLGLKPGEQGEILAAYIAFPSLAVRPAAQRYTRLADLGGRQRYRYESATFQADLAVDAHGLVLDYPGYWRREAPLG